MIPKRRLLDLFSGAGGCSVGYHRAGFDVTGVDNRPMPRYPFEFIQDDAMDVLADREFLAGFDVIHASPPCQAYSVANNIHGRSDHPDLVVPVRDALLERGGPYVIENVPGAPLRNPMLLCGLSLGINVKRHRLFESNVFMMAPPCGSHAGDWLLVFGHTVLERGHVIGKAKGGGNTIKRKHTTTARGREAMGIDWMNRDELSQAHPARLHRVHRLSVDRPSGCRTRGGVRMTPIAAGRFAADPRRRSSGTGPARGTIPRRSASPPWRGEPGRTNLPAVVPAGPRRAMGKRRPGSP